MVFKWFLNGFLNGLLGPLIVASRTSIYYLLAKVGFDTADNKPVKFARSPRTDPAGVASAAADVLRGGGRDPTATQTAAARCRRSGRVGGGYDVRRRRRPFRIGNPQRR